MVRGNPLHAADSMVFCGNRYTQVGAQWRFGVFFST